MEKIFWIKEIFVIGYLFKYSYTDRMPLNMSPIPLRCSYPSEYEWLILYQRFCRMISCHGKAQRQNSVY